MVKANISSISYGAPIAATLQPLAITKSVQRRQPILGGTNLDELSVGLGQHEVMFERHVGRGNGADYLVEGRGVVHGPIFVIISSNEFVRTNLHRVTRRPLSSQTTDLWR